MRKRVELDSSAITEVVYDSETRILDLKFREGEYYRYFAVSRFTFDALITADSAGAFWNSVKDSYRYDKLS